MFSLPLIVRWTRHMSAIMVGLSLCIFIMAIKRTHQEFIVFQVFHRFFSVTFFFTSLCPLSTVFSKLVRAEKCKFFNKNSE